MSIVVLGPSVQVTPPAPPGPGPATMTTGLRKRWKDPAGTIYEWDSQHGTVEVYSRSGKRHLGEYDPITGEQTKPADSTRKVQP